MENIDVRHAVQHRALMCAYAPSTLQGFVDLADVAAVARLVILDPAPHNRARYDLVGENASLAQVAHIVERVAGLEPGGVTSTVVPREEVVQRGVVHMPRTVEGGDYARDAMDRLLYYYDKRCVADPNQP